jgi:glycosyltransferase involved in cell wall biosynthesis
LNHLRRISIIGNALPRLCGIATFTTDLRTGLSSARPAAHIDLVAMTDVGQTYTYPDYVDQQIREEVPDDYRRAALKLNAAGVELISLQHEFGIFGGVAGDLILTLLDRLTMPVVTTFHTILEHPTPDQRRVMRAVADRSAHVIAMAKKGRDLLTSIYGVAADKIAVIPHGVPDFSFVDPDEAKLKCGYSGRSVILTFGLLGPSKGVEVMIDAMVEVIRRRPDALYVVLGATHPKLLRAEGDTYRDSLLARVERLGLRDHVIFLNQFVDQTTLLNFIAMCDVYVTPYLNVAQMTSGTLAYSFGLGKAVVSTPYWHASELLADGLGLLVPFGDSEATAKAVADLLTDPVRQKAMRRRAYAESRAMTWARVAGRYLEVFDRATGPISRPPVSAGTIPFTRRAAPAPSVRRCDFQNLPRPNAELGHFLAMCDDTGMAQHAVFAVPDRAHGYCVDDNARALILVCARAAAGGRGLDPNLNARFGAFIQHAWNPDRGRFRNFMGYDRRWLEDLGSEDSHGRTLWALGACQADDVNPAHRLWARGLFDKAIKAVETFTSPRAWAFALLGLNACVRSDAAAPRMEYFARRLADRLMARLTVMSRPDWIWFENSLAYDNARLCQALILTGRRQGHAGYVAAGLSALRWLQTQQTAEAGHFRPIGTAVFKPEDAGRPIHFDQQPLEVAATVAACLEAARVDPGANWLDQAQTAFQWFLGANDLGLSLIDPETGACCDGLHADRVNENQGAESVLAFLMSLTELGSFQAQKGADDLTMALHGGLA